MEGNSSQKNWNQLGLPILSHIKQECHQSLIQEYIHNQKKLCDSELSGLHNIDKIAISIS